MRKLEISAITLAAAALTLTACATPQTNPYYAHNGQNQSVSTQTHGAATNGVATTQSASYQTPVSYRTPSEPIFIHDPQPQQAAHEAVIPYTPTHTTPAAQPVYASPAPTVYAPTVYTAATTVQSVPVTSVSSSHSTGVMVETGGQNGGISGQNLQTQSMLDYAAYTPAQAQPTPTRAPTYSAQNISTYSPHSSSTVQSGAGIAYIVQEDDTVYSLSRRTCSSVDAIAQMNNLPPSFLIKAGATLTLPASQC